MRAAGLKGSGVVLGVVLALRLVLTVFYRNRVAGLQTSGIVLALRLLHRLFYRNEGAASDARGVIIVF